MSGSTVAGGGASAFGSPLVSPQPTRSKLKGLSLTYGIGERMYYALHRRKNPYKAKYVDSTAQWPPVIDCGHNPFLMAHLVEDLQVETHDDWTETATWRDVRSKRRKTFASQEITPRDCRKSPTSTRDLGG